VGGGDVDDPAPTFGLHPRQRRLDGVEVGDEVDGDDPVELVFGKILDRGDELHAGIVHQYVAAADLGLGGRDHGADLGGLGHVGRRIGGLGHTHRGTHGAAGGGDVLGLAEAVQHHLRAFLSEAQRDGEPDAGGGAGHEGAAALQQLGHVVMSLIGAGSGPQGCSGQAPEQADKAF
jgi:hypothetical protein